MDEECPEYGKDSPAGLYHRHNPIRLFRIIPLNRGDSRHWLHRGPAAATTGTAATITTAITNNAAGAHAPRHHKHAHPRRPTITNKDDRDGSPERPEDEATGLFLMSPSYSTTILFANSEVLVDDRRQRITRSNNRDNSAASRHATFL